MHMATTPYPVGPVICDGGTSLPIVDAQALDRPVLPAQPQRDFAGSVGSARPRTPQPLRLATSLALAATTLAAPAHAQVISWSHAITATTALSFGIRLVPAASRRVDALFRPLSPYRNARRPNGAYYLPDTRVFTHTCDLQHLRWIGIGDWSGPRFVTQAMWLPVGFFGAVGARMIGASSTTSIGLSMTGMTTYHVARTFLIPGYHPDPLAYAASIGTWGYLGAYAGSRVHAHKRFDWKVPVALAGIWALTYPWGTPWADDPSNCARG